MSVGPVSQSLNHYALQDEFDEANTTPHAHQTTTHHGGDDSQFKDKNDDGANRDAVVNIMSIDFRTASEPGDKQGDGLLGGSSPV